MFRVKAGAARQVAEWTNACVLAALIVVGVLGLSTTAAAKPNAYVIVDSANLYRAAKPTSPKLSSNGLRLLRVVRRSGAWLEVELVAQHPGRANAEQCGIHGGGKFLLRFFIRQRDALQVLKHDVTKRFRNGARIRIQQGMPLRGPILRKLAAGARLGRELVLSKSRLKHSAKGSYVLVKKPTHAKLTRTFRVRVPKNTYVVVKRRARNWLFVEVVRPCLKFTGWISRSAVGKDDLGVTGGAGVVPDGPGVRWIKRSAPVFWSDGTRAGTTDKVLQVTGAWVTRKTLRCVTTAPGAGIQVAQLCFRSGEVYKNFWDAKGSQ